MAALIDAVIAVDVTVKYETPPGMEMIMEWHCYDLGILKGLRKHRIAYLKIMGSVVRPVVCVLERLTW